MTHLRSVHSEETLLTRDELAKRMSTSPDTVDRMRKRGMPCIRWGKRFVRFRASDCMAWLEAHEEAEAA